MTIQQGREYIHHYLATGTNGTIVSTHTPLIYISGSKRHWRVGFTSESMCMIALSSPSCRALPTCMAVSQDLALGSSGHWRGGGGGGKYYRSDWAGVGMHSSSLLCHSFWEALASATVTRETWCNKVGFLKEPSQVNRTLCLFHPKVLARSI